MATTTRPTSRPITTVCQAVANSAPDVAEAVVAVEAESHRRRTRQQRPTQTSAQTRPYALYATANDATSINTNRT